MTGKGLQQRTPGFLFLSAVLASRRLYIHGNCATQDGLPLANATNLNKASESVPCGNLTHLIFTDWS